MRYLRILALLASATAAGMQLYGQSASTTTTLADLNGGYTAAGPTVSAAKSRTGSSRVEYTPGVNGSLVPRETVEEKVLRDDATGRVIERYVRRHDQNGNPGPLEKTVIEERKSGASVTIQTTVYRGDLNGNLQAAERSLTRATTQGAVTTAETTIERPGIEGQFAPAERVLATTVAQSKTQQQQTVTRLRRDASGNFYESVKETSTTESNGNQTTVNRAQYVNGELFEQAVERSTKDARGAETTVVDIYSTQAPGLSADSTGRLALKEQQQITREPGAGGKVTETVISRKPTVSDANRLGPAQVISKSVCQGGGC